MNYDISLLDLELGGDFSYQGIVKMEVQVKEATDKIVLNAHQLKVHSAEMTLNGHEGMSI